MRHNARNMMDNARSVYSQWKKGKQFSFEVFKEVLAYFEKKTGRKSGSVHLCDNIHSKMKLLYSLSEQGED